MTVAETTDARKVRLDAQAALKLLDGIDVLYVSKGKRSERVDLTRSTRAQAGALLLGPTGNLRAPAARVGRTLLVGFDEQTWSEVLAT